MKYLPFVERYISIDGCPLPDAPIGMLPSAQAALDPDRPALTFEGMTLSRVGFDMAANRCARQLAVLGVQCDDVVILALPNGLEFYQWAYGVIKVGATVCHVSHRLTQTEIEQIVALAKPSLVIGDIAVPDGIRRINARTTLNQGLSGEAFFGAVSRCWKIGTSGGSTGRPKLIVDPHSAIWGPDKEGRRRTANATIVNPAPLFHAAPFNNMILALAQGSHVVEMGHFDAESYLALVAHHRADWAYLVPTMMSRICQLPDQTRARYDISSLKTVVHMAASCPVWVKQAWIDWLGPEVILELYGGSERLGMTFIDGREWLDHRGSVGKPLPGSEMTVFDDRGEHCPVGEIGEIHFRAAAGSTPNYRYIGSDQKQHYEWQSYGDMGWLDADGYLYIADRRTDMIVSGGANIYPAEIEGALSMITGVIDNVVIGLPDQDLGQRVHAIVQLGANVPNLLTENAILSSLARRIAKYKLPRTIEFTTEILRDEAGKVRRSLLREQRIAQSLPVQPMPRDPTG